VKLLPDPSGNAKTRWNAAHYTQVKASIDIEIASAFKLACEVAGVSMASQISRFMAEYAGTPEKGKPNTGLLSTRRKRRDKIKSIISLIGQVRDAEEGYKDRIPENLQGSIRYETAEEYLSAMDDAIELLESAY
jgi:hypothetical protein